MKSGVDSFDLRQRVLFTFLLLLLYRFGTFVPIPGIDSRVIQKIFSGSTLSIFGMVNLFSGGAMERMSIFALNIMPYITASIIMQLLTSMHSGLESLRKEGEYGKSKINQYTRYLTIFLAILQSFGVYYALASSQSSAFISDSSIFLVTTVISLVGGTIMLMWFGEKITSSGVGNGISLIIFVGIVSSLPATIIEMFTLLKSGSYTLFAVLMFFALFFFGLLIVCFVEKVQRKIKIQYPGTMATRSLGVSDSSFLPLKINLSGVIPPIFASSLLMLPVAISQIVGGGDGWLFLLIQRGSLLYSFVFSLLILFFSYFYSSLIFNTTEVANNLKKSNCFIFGIRPGIATSEYLDKVVSRLTLLGVFYLIFICVTPEVLITKSSIPLHIGGTGILIMVNVVMDLVNQVHSYSLNKRYVAGIGKRRRVRVRG